jgi:hypothetical protein|tara:strand:+ start:1179 stop:1619 length:441 start_codon:yes stop_codon:yes gene_type:complete
LILVKKKYDDGGKFSLKDLLAAYKATKPKRGEYSFESDELGITEGDATGDNTTTFLKNLTPEQQDELLRSGAIDKIIEREGGASATGGGGVTVLKGEGYKKKYKGTEGGGTDISYREGTINPFKRLGAAFRSLRPRETTYANPRFL